MVSVIIEKTLLISLLESARRKYPAEFFCLLGGREKRKVIYITEVIYVPWKEGETHATVDINVIPKDVLGSFHSHPGPPEPSPEDLRSFPWFGKVHVIAGYPFTPENVRVYDTDGNELEFFVV